MAYVSPNFKTKKALKEAISQGRRVSVFSPGPFGCKTDGTEYIEGPHYPEPHRWYAKVTVKGGYVIACEGAKLPPPKTELEKLGEILSIGRKS